MIKKVVILVKSKVYPLCAKCVNRHCGSKKDRKLRVGADGTSGTGLAVDGDVRSIEIVTSNNSDETKDV